MEKKLLNQYLTLCVKHHFNKDINLNDEYGFAENLVSKKTIIAPTFTEKISSDPQLKMFLSSLITEINNEKWDTEMIQERLEALQNDRKRVKEIT